MSIFDGVKNIVIRKDNTSNDIPDTLSNDINKFDLNATIFISSLLLADGFLFPTKFEIYKEFINKVYSNRISENATLRTFLLERLINPVCPSDIVEILAKEAAIEKVTLETKIDVVDFAISALEQSTYIIPEHINNIDLLIKKFELPRNNFSVRLDEIQEGSTYLKNSNLQRDTNSKSLLQLKQVKEKTTLDFRTSQSAENEKTETLMKNIQPLIEIINSDVLKEECYNLQKQIQNSEYKIVLAGEIKHGKSSLFNKLLNANISTVQEGTATTAALVELFYSEEPSYSVKWMDEDCLDKTFMYIKENETNQHVKEYGFYLQNLTEKPYFKANETFTGIHSQSELEKFICVEGEYSAGVECVKIGMPIQCLKHGAVIVDTPGVNDPMKVRDRITNQQVMTADTLVFVMRADKFGTESERIFLETALNKGKIFELIIVLTHIDKIPESKEQQRIYENVRSWLNKVSDNPLLRLAPIYAFDARTNTAAKNEKVYINNMGFEEFVNRLSSPSAKDRTMMHYVDWIKSKRENLSNLAIEETSKFLGIFEDSENKKDVGEKFQYLIKQLEDANTVYIEQLDARIKLLMKKQKDDLVTIQYESSKCKELIMENLRTAVEIKVRELEADYSNNAKWARFNKDIADNIVMKNIQSLEYRTEKTLLGWEEVLNEFSKNIYNDFLASDKRISEISTQYGEIVTKNNANVYMVCRAQDLFGNLGDTMKKAYYIGSDYAIDNGINVDTVIPIVQATVGIAFPPTIPWIVGTGAAAILFYKISPLSDKENVKNAFIEKKISDLKTVVDERFSIFDEKINEVFKNIDAEVNNCVDNLYNPIINATTQNIKELKYQVEISQIMKTHIMDYANIVIKSETLK